MLLSSVRILWPKLEQQASYASKAIGIENGMDYSNAVAKVWRHHRSVSGGDPVDLVRYAVLAASSHNTQPWEFRLEGNEISILPDLSRRCPAVDPDDHHLFASIGCAVENLLLAAQAAGLHVVRAGNGQPGRTQVDWGAIYALRILISFAESERYCEYPKFARHRCHRLRGRRQKTLDRGGQVLSTSRAPGHRTGLADRVHQPTGRSAESPLAIRRFSRHWQRATRSGCASRARPEDAAHTTTARGPSYRLTSLHGGMSELTRTPNKTARRAK